MEPAHVLCDTTPSGTPGRPSYVIPFVQIEAMRALGLNYEQMSRILGISSRTLRRHRQLLGMPVGENYTDMSDEALDALISSILNVCTVTTTQYCINNDITTFIGDNGIRCFDDERCFIITWHSCAARTCAGVLTQSRSHQSVPKKTGSHISQKLFCSRT